MCVQCKSENIVASGFRPANTSHVSVLQNCTNIDCSSQPFTQVGFIRNQLILQIKRFIRRFYANWLVCDDPSCNLNTRVYSHVNVNNLPVCLMCKQGSLIRQYTETDLYVQMCYFQYMFDLTKYEHKSKYPFSNIENRQSQKLFPRYQNNARDRSRLQSSERNCGSVLEQISLL